MFYDAVVQINEVNEKGERSVYWMRIGSAKDLPNNGGVFVKIDTTPLKPWNGEFKLKPVKES